MISDVEKKHIPLMVLWITILGQSAMTLYIPSFPNMALELNLSNADIKSTLTFFLLGFGISQLFYGPLSDRYGRKPILLRGIALFSFFCFINIFVHSLALFLFIRFVQGIGCGVTITIARSVLRDCFSGKELASAASYLSMGFALGLGLAPLIGSYLLKIFGWRANFLFLAIMSSILFILFFKKLPETSGKSLASLSAKAAIYRTITRYHEILVNRTFWKYLLGGVFSYSVVIAWNIMTPFLIQKQFGFSANAYGWMTLFIATSYYLAAAFNRSTVRKHAMNKIFKWGACLIVFSGALIVIATPFYQYSLWIVLIPMAVATFGQASIFSNTIASALHEYPHMPGKASAMFISLQMILATIISGIMTFIPDGAFYLGIVIFFLGSASLLILSKINIKIS